MKSNTFLFRTILLAMFTLSLLAGAIVTDYYFRHEVTGKAKRLLVEQGVELSVESTIQAARTGETTLLETLETAGISLGTTDKVGTTPLLVAVRSGNQPVVDFLMQRDSVAETINQLTEPGRETPLSVALNARDFALADQLIARGAYPTVDKTPGNPFLVESIREDDTEMLNYLLRQKVDVDYRGALSTTALSVAAERDRIDLMKQLINAGADLNVRGVSGKPLLIESVNEGNLEKFDLLISQGADVHLKIGETIGSEMNALSFAVRGGNTEMIDVLLQKGTKSDVYGISGQPLVHEVVVERKMGVVTQLLEHGSSFDVITEEGETPMGAAVVNEDIDMVDLLLGGGVSASPQLEKGNSPLMLAVGSGNVPIAHQLLASGAKADKNALLAKSYSLRDDPLMSLLLNSGADPEAVFPGTDQRVFDAAVQDGATGAVRTLLAAGASIGDNLWAALLTGQDDLIHLILDAGADPRQKGPEGEDPLDFCLKQDRYRAARELLAGGADPDALYNESKTWMEHAIREGNSNVAEELVRAGATVKGIRCSDGHTLLAWSVAHEMPTVVKALLDAGVDPDADERSPATSEFQGMFSSSTFKYHLRSDRRIRPIMMAAAQRNHAIAKILMDGGANGRAYTPKYLMAAIIGSWYKDAKMQQIALLGKLPEIQPRKVVVDLSAQRVTLYENGIATYSTRCSTGKSGYRTPLGEYVISDRHRHHNSSIYGSSMPYFQRFSYSAFGLHTGHVPDYPASHGCIRLPDSAARHLFGKLEVGDYAVIQP